MNKTLLEESRKLNINLMKRIMELCEEKLKTHLHPVREYSIYDEQPSEEEFNRLFKELDSDINTN